MSTHMQVATLINHGVPEDLVRLIVMVWNECMESYGYWDGFHGCLNWGFIIDYNPCHTCYTVSVADSWDHFRRSWRFKLASCQDCADEHMHKMDENGQQRNENSGILVRGFRFTASHTNGSTCHFGHFTNLVS